MVSLLIFVGFKFFTCLFLFVFVFDFVVAVFFLFLLLMGDVVFIDIDPVDDATMSRLHWWTVRTLILS